MGKQKKPKPTAEQRRGRFVPHYSPLLDGPGHHGVDYRETTAQKIMREDMSREPLKVDAVMDQVMGVQNEDSRARDAVVNIVNTSEPITLPLSTWLVVQAMMERAYTTGQHQGFVDGITEAKSLPHVQEEARQAADRARYAQEHRPSEG